VEKGRRVGGLRSTKSKKVKPRERGETDRKEREKKRKIKRKVKVKKKKEKKKKREQVFFFFFSFLFFSFLSCFFGSPPFQAKHLSSQRSELTLKVSLLDPLFNSLLPQPESLL